MIMTRRRCYIQQQTVTIKDVKPCAESDNRPSLGERTLYFARHPKFNTQVINPWIRPGDYLGWIQGNNLC